MSHQTLTSAIARPLEGYSIYTLTWNVQATPNGPHMLLNGSIDEVSAQLTKMNSNWEAEFAAHTSNNAVAAPPAPEKRNIITGFELPNCNLERWGCADTDNMSKAIDLLYRFAHEPTSGPGWGQCAQLVCWGGDSIWWCTDGAVAEKSFKVVADGAYFIRDRCDKSNPFQKSPYNGQVFRKDKPWNVVIRSGCKN